MAALGIAGFIMPVSNGDNVFKGHSVKPIHGGQPALCGLSSAYLAQAGYRSGPLEGEPPRYHAALSMLGTNSQHGEASVSDLGESWTCLETGFKPYPVGLFNIGPVEICLDLVSQGAIDPSRIESIDVTTYHDAWRFTGQKYTTPASSHVDANLSMPYSIAVALIDGTVTSDQLTGERLADPEIHDLAGCVTVRWDESMDERYPEEWPVRIDITLDDGETITHSLDAVNWSPRRPPTWDQLAEKASGLAEPVIGHENALRLIHVVGELEDVSALAPLMDLCRARAS